ncbi:MAG: PIN domain-containing protein [Dermatophilaceae bacterium]
MTNVFLDTNVLAYQFDGADRAKQARAGQVVTQADCVFFASTQVLLELFVVLTRKLRPTLPHAAAARVVRELSRLTVVPADSQLVLRAVDTAGQHRISVWDAMIIEAAAEAACDELWSEDLAHGSVRGIRVVNPFAG